MKRMKTLAVSALLASCCLPAQAAKITIACGAVGIELDLCKAGAERWAKQTGNTVEVFDAGNQDRLTIYQQQFAAKSSDIDVYQIDIIWSGLLAQHLVDLSGRVPQTELNKHFPGTIDAVKVDGKLIALPWGLGGGLLFYRSDLLQKYGYKNPPTTWTELAVMAKKVMAGEQKTNNAFTGYVFQGRNYEGLTCNALEWLVSYGGGTIIDSKGNITINNSQAAKALDMAASLIGTVSPKGVTTYQEEDSRGIFQSGNALFMRNWSYAWKLAQADGSLIKGKVGVARLPTGTGVHAAALGGQNLAVSAYSKNQDAAISLIRYLTSPTEQKIRVIQASFEPTIPALYKDTEVLNSNPLLASLQSAYLGTVARPSNPTKLKYNQVSAAFSSAVTDVLTGKTNGKQAVAQLAADLARIKGRGW